MLFLGQIVLLYFYIVKELIFPFLLSTGVISTVIMMNQIFEFIPFLQSSGIELGSILRLILFSLPPVLMVSMPVATLIGVYAGISRLAADSELIVMRASGVSLSYFYKPVLAVAGVISVIALVLTFFLGPYGVRGLEELKYNILKKQTRLNLTVQQINQFFGQKLIYIFDQEEDFFKGIFIADWVATPESSVIEARSGKIYLDDKKRKIVFRLVDGKIHTLVGEEGYRTIAYERLDYDLTPPESDQKHIPGRFKKDKGLGENRLSTELTIIELNRAINQSPPGSKEYYGHAGEFHARMVTILSCICFAIFAMPMGVYNPRNPKTGNIVTMIFVLVVYFMIYAQLRTMVTQGEISPLSLYLALLSIILSSWLRFHKINQNIESFTQFFTGMQKQKS